MNAGVAALTLHSCRKYTAPKRTVTRGSLGSIWLTIESMGSAAQDDLPNQRSHEFRRRIG